jgi:hypothetical protein
LFVRWVLNWQMEMERLREEVPRLVSRRSLIGEKSQFHQQAVETELQCGVQGSGPMKQPTVPQTPVLDSLSLTFKVFLLCHPVDSDRRGLSTRSLRVFGWIIHPGRSVAGPMAAKSIQIAADSWRRYRRSYRDSPHSSFRRLDLTERTVLLRIVVEKTQFHQRCCSRNSW